MPLTQRCQRNLVLWFGAASLACAPAPRMGDAVDVAEESAIIVWDEATKTQHFIRRASFRTTAKDFGFLVPTPTVPELKEASDSAFAFLEKLTAPRTVERRVPARDGAAPAPAAAAAVTVVTQVKVAGYDAVVLEANDAKALAAWLEQHGYASSPELVDWFKPYLERRWKISAFKIDRDAQRNGLAEAAAVRMSFKSDVPFFPYREPARPARSGSGAEPRLLRVYLLATARMEGVLGVSAASAAWPGRAVWADRISEQDRAALLEHVKLTSAVAAGALWLTEFADGSSPRPAAHDLVFRTAADPSVLHKPDEIRLLPERRMGDYVAGFIAVGAVVALLAGLLYAAWRFAVFVLRKAKS